MEPSAAHGGDEPVDLVFAALVESFAEADDALRSDRASAGARDFAETPEDDRYADAYYTQLFALEGPRLAARLTLAAERLGSLWLSAWEEAGRPALDTSYRFPYVRGQARLILASLDGSAAPVVHDAVARGVMPNLAGLRERGATARGSITSLPAKTAAGHATLFTGTWPDRHGVTGNKVVLRGASVLEGVSGYRSEALLAEPLWVTAARQGQDATVLCATQDYPYDPYEAGKRFGGFFGQSLTFATGYKGPMLDDAVYRAADLPPRAPSGWHGSPAPGATREVELAVGSSTVYGLLYDDPGDPVSGFDTLLLSINKDADRAVRLKPRAPGDPESFASVTATLAGLELPVFFRLFALSPDGSELLLYRARAGVFLSNRTLVPPAV